MRVVLSIHASLQANERFPREAFIPHEEVNDGFAAGRCSPKKPAGLDGPSHASNLYVWTEDRRRVYAVKVDYRDESQFIIVTVMRPTEAQLARWQ